MEDVLNASIAGGVIVGTSADISSMPYLPILIGMIGGTISSIGFNKI